MKRTYSRGLFACWDIYVARQSPLLCWRHARGTFPSTIIAEQRRALRFYLWQCARDQNWNRLVLFIKTLARVPPTEGLRICFPLSSLGDFSMPSAFRYCGFKPRVMRINMKTSLQPGDALRCVGQHSVAAVFTPNTSSQSKEVRDS